MNIIINYIPIKASGIVKNLDVEAFHYWERKKMRIGVIGDNSIEMIEKVIDIWNCGECVILIDWRIPYKTIVEMLEEVNAEKCYIDEKYLKGTNQKIGNKKFEVITYLSSDNRIKKMPKELYDKFKGNYSKTEALILFSSGTTGKAKGIILSHYAINKNADEVFGYMRLDSSDSIYIQKTLCHSSTFVCELLVALKHKIKLFISSTVITPNIILKNIMSNKITVTCLNPTILRLLTIAAEKGQYVFDTLKVIYCSGAVLDINIYERAKKVFKNVSIFNVYGLTEAGPRVAAQIPNCYDSQGSVGKVLNCVTIKIVDNQGREKGVNEQGIINIKTDCAFIGYANCVDKRLADEWINTKDIGYLNDNNELYVLGRSDNMINIDSHNIFAEEVEQRILDLKNVENCLVYGEKNEKSCYLLYCDYVGKIEDEKEIITFLKNYLPLYEIPKKYRRVDSIAYTLNGKKKRNKNLGEYD